MFFCLETKEPTLIVIWKSFTLPYEIASSFLLAMTVSGNRQPYPTLTRAV